MMITEHRYIAHTPTIGAVDCSKQTFEVYFCLGLDGTLDVVVHNSSAHPQVLQGV
jgi:hypothetical protein